MITLAVDASTYVGTVAVLRDHELIATAEVAMRGAHEERLAWAVADALSRAGVALGPAHRVVCGAGPGSFTSLRIAGSIAKGLAMGWGATLLAVPSLGLIVAGEPALGAGRYLAALDALRGESYAALYERDRAGLTYELAPARLVAAGAIAALAAEFEATAVGPATDRPLSPHARGAAALLPGLGSEAVADLAGWEPSYGRLAEAQVRWEAAHGRPLPAG